MLKEIVILDTFSKNVLDFIPYINKSIDIFILGQKDMEKISIIVICFCVVSSMGIVHSIEVSSQMIDDFDPLVDIHITIDVFAIRALEEFDNPLSEADFFLKLYINNDEYISEIWNDLSYIYDTPFSLTVDVPDEQEYVFIQMQLWEWNSDENLLCDIGNKAYDVMIEYNIKNGHWMGDDALFDLSGYGRVNGCDDGSIYEKQRDCELWFDIYQNDYDNDSIPYWQEINVYNTNPLIDNSYDDLDNDFLPLVYEHKWGFNPLIYEDHLTDDYDNDSLTTYEEYLTKEYRTDPFRKDVLIEYDFMQDNPTGESNIVPLDADDLLKNPFHRRNINIHIDRNEMIPFDRNVGIQEVFDIYDEHYLHNDPDNWRRSVFHYGLFVSECFPPGYGFSGDVDPYWGYGPGTNGFVISCRQMEDSSVRDSNTLAYTFGSAIMHEMGHNFGIRGGNPPGCDNRGCIYPWRKDFWLYQNYKSCMNYRYTYKIFDYSDGSHGVRDFDDWSAIDLTYFEIPVNE